MIWGASGLCQVQHSMLLRAQSRHTYLDTEIIRWVSVETETVINTTKLKQRCEERVQWDGLDCGVWRDLIKEPTIHMSFAYLCARKSPKCLTNCLILSQAFEKATSMSPLLQRGKWRHRKVESGAMVARSPIHPMLTWATFHWERSRDWPFYIVLILTTAWKSVSRFTDGRPEAQNLDNCPQLQLARSKTAAQSWITLTQGAMLFPECQAAKCSQPALLSKSQFQPRVCETDQRGAVGLGSCSSTH